MSVVVSYSGASTKIAFHFGVAKALHEYEIKPRVITGISAGAIISLPVAMGKWKEAEKLLLSFSLDKHVWGKRPIGKKGGFTLAGIKRVLFGAKSFGDQEGLRATLKSIITPRDFEIYKGSLSMPACHVGAVDLKTGSRHIVNLKEVTYEEYLDAVMASSTIIPFVPSIKTQSKFLVDGGYRNHILSGWAIEKFAPKAHVSVYSRPENFRDMIDTDYEEDNAIDPFTRSLDIMSAEISKSDEDMEDVLCGIHRVEQIKIFPPYKLAKDIYETSPEKNKLWMSLGYQAAIKALKSKPLNHV